MAGLPTSTTGKSAADVARAAARDAGQMMAERFRALAADPIERVVKGRGNYVTEADLASEAATLELLGSEFPEHRVLAEEKTMDLPDWDRGWLWVVDPLDGTANFARGIPTFAFSIALCLDGEPVLGLTYQPITGEEFFAERGEGLWVNGVRSQVSRAGTLAEAVMGIGLGYDYNRSKKALQLLADLWPGVQMIQNIGSAALGLAYTASSRFDVYVHHFLAPWDMAAGVILVREGGGVIVDRAGEPVSIFSQGLVAGALGPVQEFLQFSKDREWK